MLAKYMLGKHMQYLFNYYFFLQKKGIYTYVAT